MIKGQNGLVLGVVGFSIQYVTIKKLLMHLTNPKNKVIKITKETCVGTFSTMVDNAEVINSISMPREGIQGKDQLQQDKAAKNYQVACKLSNSVEIWDRAKHRLYKVIKTNADVFQWMGSLGQQM